MENANGMASEAGIYFWIGGILGVILGASLVGAGVNAEWRADAIRAGVGEYAPDTGNFRWKEKP